MLVLCSNLRIHVGDPIISLWEKVKKFTAHLYLKWLTFAQWSNTIHFFFSGRNTRQIRQICQILLISLKKLNWSAILCICSFSTLLLHWRIQRDAAGVLPIGYRLFCFDLQNFWNVTTLEVSTSPMRSAPLREILDPALLYYGEKVVKFFVRHTVYNRASICMNTVDRWKLSCTHMNFKDFSMWHRMWTIRYIKIILTKSRGILQWTSQI